MHISRTAEPFGLCDRSAAMTESLEDVLLQHLLRLDGQEDLTFALWNPSKGDRRVSALLYDAVPPGPGDREVHGNVSFQAHYFERALELAAAAGSGVAFLHSHPGPGWQDMSADDVRAERRMAGAAAVYTGLPLVGLTVGTDAIWSARMWLPGPQREHELRWCESVRVLGQRLRVDFANRLRPPPVYRNTFRRTRNVWGEEAHHALARLRVGIVGLGSVGMSVAEQLARSGFERLTLIDFDEVQEHNLDRLQGSDTRCDVGRLKVVLGRDLVDRSSTADRVEVTDLPFSVVEEPGYRAALDCDVLFSCVDRPRARQILNHVAYAHLIPVIDGGIAVRFNEVERFKGAEWQAQTVGPGRACLECLEAFTGEDADTERQGKLDDPSYLRGLPKDHRLKRNENVYPFSMHLAATEVLQLIALAGGLPNLVDVGVQRVHLVAGILESDSTRRCVQGCDADILVASGDRAFLLTGQDHAADAARERRSHRQ